MSDITKAKIAKLLGEQQNREDVTAKLDFALEMFQVAHGVSDELLIQQMTAFITNHGLAAELLPWLESVTPDHVESDDDGEVES